MLKYGWPEAAGPRAVEVEVELGESALRLAFRDRGLPFDPSGASASPLPEPPRTLEEAPIGGLGLGLVRKAASAITYRREGGENRTEVRIDLAAG